MDPDKVTCPVCGKVFRKAEHMEQHHRDKHRQKQSAEKPEYPEGFEPDWGSECEVCGQSPVVPLTGLCGPCTWGEADTMGGNW